MSAHQGLLQALLVAAIQFLGLPCDAHCPVQGLSQVHEASLMLSQLVSSAGAQCLVSLPAAGQLFLHTGQHWPRSGVGMVTREVTAGAHPAMQCHSKLTSAQGPWPSLHPARPAPTGPTPLTSLGLAQLCLGCCPRGPQVSGPHLLEQAFDFGQCPAQLLARRGRGISWRQAVCLGHELCGDLRRGLYTSQLTSSQAAPLPTAASPSPAAHLLSL